MTKSAFRAAAVRHLGLMFVVGAGFTNWMQLLWATVCETPLGVICFPLHLLLMFVGVPLLVAACAVLLIRAVHRRVMTLGLNALWTLAMAVWLIGGAVLLGFFTRIAQRGLTSTTLFIAAASAFAIAFLLFLAFAVPPSIDNRRTDRRLAMHVAQLTASVATIVAGLPMVLSAAGLLRAAGPPSTSLVWACWLGFAVFSGALAYLILTQEDDSSIDGGPPTQSSPLGSGGSLPRATFGRRAR